MTTRRELLIALGAGALTAPLATMVAGGVHAQGKIARIGYLVQASLVEPPSAERAAFLQGLRELGYVEGRNLRIEYRSAEGEAEFLPALAVELAQQNVDVIVATSIEPIKAAMEATRTIPIVMTSASDPVEQGLIKSLAHPGGNVTGLTFIAAELVAKQLELLRDMLPQARRVAVLRNPRNPADGLLWQTTQKSAASLGLTLLPFEMGQSDAVPQTLASIARTRPDALFLLTDARTIGYSSIINDFATRNHIPSFAGWNNFADSGGILSYAPNLPELFRRAAIYVDKILKGTKPADLPVEEPTRFELVVNLKTARALDIAIPQSILIRADKVIE